MVRDVRTKRGKLVGKHDDQKKTFNIKDGSKVTLIKIPSCGLQIYFTTGDGITEAVHIPMETT